MPEDPSGILMIPQGRQCGQDRQCNGRHGDEFEQSGIYCCNKITGRVEPGDAQCPDNASDNQCRHPDDEAFARKSILFHCGKSPLVMYVV